MAIEIINTHGNINKLEIYKTLGIKEVWFAFVSGEMEAYSLHNGVYESVTDSRVLPGLSLGMIKESIKEESTRLIVDKFRALISR